MGGRKAGALYTLWQESSQNQEALCYEDSALNGYLPLLLTMASAGFWASAGQGSELLSQREFSLLFLQGLWQEMLWIMMRFVGIWWDKLGFVGI
ncbi:MAG: hypothetical protein LBF40_10740 [Deltaproteobacteria bacterium]|jgi:hypothetical protein|nr:hypothetical protein [Deltaproteobacteria bacterium]